MVALPATDAALAPGFVLLENHSSGGANCDGGISATYTPLPTDRAFGLRMTLNPENCAVTVDRVEPQLVPMATIAQPVALVGRIHFCGDIAVMSGCHEFNFESVLLRSGQANACPDRISHEKNDAGTYDVSQRETKSWGGVPMPGQECWTGWTDSWWQAPCCNQAPHLLEGRSGASSTSYQCLMRTANWQTFRCIIEPSGVGMNIDTAPAVDTTVVFPGQSAPWRVH